MRHSATNLLCCLMGLMGIAVGLPADYKLPNVNISTVAEINALHDRISDLGPSSVEDTVKEVEDLLKKNSNLPRLTRGEILDILDNITKSDKEKLKKMKTRHGDERAIMVVMPYSGEDGNVQELYTKPPITHIIGDTEEDKNSTKKPYIRRWPSTKKPDVVKSTVSQKAYTIRRHHKSTTTSPVPTSSSAPAKATTTEKLFFTNTKSISTAKPFTYMKPLNGGVITTTITSPFKPITITNSPAVVKYSNHKYPDEIVDAQTFSDEGLRIVSPPSFPIYTTTKKPSMKPIVVADRPIKTSAPIKRNKPPLQQQNSTVNLPLSEDFQLPENLKEVVKDLDFLIRNNPNKFNDDFIPLPDSTKLLESYQQQKIQSTTTTTTTTTETPDISDVADNLTPEMQQLLMSFGLIPDPNPKPVPVEINESLLEPHSVIKPDSYLSFKRLPQTDEGSSDDMNEFLASFGLGRNAARSQKAIAFKNADDDFEAVPDKFKTILGDIGLTNDTFKGSSFQPKQPDRTHVFSPSDTQYASKEEIEKLNQLLGVIKQLEKINGTATEHDLKTIDLDNLKHIVAGFNGEPFVPLNEQIGPNPAIESYDYIRNEVKRQPSVVISASKNGPIADLEASFGGSLSTTPEPNEPPKRTGFYYLVDWNSFFDIDNQKGKRVNLRFQPKIGDPKRFLSVSVP